MEGTLSLKHCLAHVFGRSKDRLSSVMPLNFVIGTTPKIHAWDIQVQYFVRQLRQFNFAHD